MCVLGCLWRQCCFSCLCEFAQFKLCLGIPVQFRDWHIKIVIFTLDLGLKTWVFIIVDASLERDFLGDEC